MRLSKLYICRDCNEVWTMEDLRKRSGYCPRGCRGSVPQPLYLWMAEKVRALFEA